MSKFLLLLLFPFLLLGDSFNFYFTDTSKKIDLINVATIGDMREQKQFFFENDGKMKQIFWRNLKEEKQISFYNFKYKQTDFFLYNKKYANDFNLQNELHKLFYETIFYYYVESIYYKNKKNSNITKIKIDEFYNFLNSNETSLKKDLDKEIEILMDKFEKEDIDFKIELKKIAKNYLIDNENEFYFESLSKGFYQTEKFFNLMDSVNIHNVSEIKIDKFDYNNIKFTFNDLIPYVNNENELTNQNYLVNLVYKDLKEKYIESFNNSNIEVYRTIIEKTIKESFYLDLKDIEKLLKISEDRFYKNKNKWDLLNSIVFFHLYNLKLEKTKEKKELYILNNINLEFKPLDVNQFEKPEDYLKLFVAEYQENYIFLFNIQKNSFSISIKPKKDFMMVNNILFLTKNLNKIIVESQKYSNNLEEGKININEY